MNFLGMGMDMGTEAIGLDMVMQGPITTLSLTARSAIIIIVIIFIIIIVHLKLPKKLAVFGFHKIANCRVVSLKFGGKCKIIGGFRRSLGTCF